MAYVVIHTGVYRLALRVYRVFRSYHRLQLRLCGRGNDRYDSRCAYHGGCRVATTRLRHSLTVPSHYVSAIFTTSYLFSFFTYSLVISGQYVRFSRNVPICVVIFATRGTSLLSVPSSAHSGAHGFTLFSLLFSSDSFSRNEANFLIAAHPLSFFPRARAKGLLKRMRKFSFFLGLSFAVQSSDR